MAKKNKKRSVSSSVEIPKTSASIAAGSTPKAGFTRASEFNPDYSYVKKDLKRIGVLAGSFFIVLVVLSFFLR
jgi:hypothetical protein